MNKKFIFFFLATLSCTTTMLATKTSLHLASFYGNTALLQTLINRQIYDIEEQDDYGQTPLHYAASKGHTECARILLLKRANVNALSNSRCTPLHYAALFGHLDCLKVLIHFGATIDLRDVKLWTPLHHAARCGHLECVEYLVEHSNANIYAKTNKSKTPINLVGSFGTEERVKKIIQYLKMIEKAQQETQELMDIDIS